MLNIFKKKRKFIGYKATTVDRKKKIGIAADSLKTFKQKCSEKFKVFQLIIKCEFSFTIFNLFCSQIDKCRLYLAKDGTEISDENYFETLEPQTLFIIAHDNDTIKNGTKKSIDFDQLATNTLKQIFRCYSTQYAM